MALKLNIRLFSTMLIGLGITLPAYANNWYMEGYGGVSQLHAGKNQVIPDVESGVQYNYFYHGSSSDSEPLYGLGIGYQWNSSRWLYQLGINYYQTGSQTIKGHIASIEPQFNWTDYKYKIDSKRLMLTGKVFFQTHTHWLPYFSVGVGYSRNEFDNYTVLHLPGGSFSNVEHFSNNKSNELAWQAGLGVIYQLTQELSLSAGYQYVDLGEAESGAGSRSGLRFKTGDLYTNEVMLGINYRF